MKKIAILALVLFYGSSQSVWADSFDINVNDQSARFIYANATGVRAQTDLGFLYNEDEYNVGHFGLHLVGQTGDQSQGLTGALGVRLYGIYNDPLEILAVGIGGALVFAPPQLAHGRLGFRLDGHFAPGVVTFQDADSMYEFNMAVEYQLLNNGWVYGGFRRIRAELDKGKNIDADEGGYVGLRIEF